MKNLLSAVVFSLISLVSFQSCENKTPATTEFDPSQFVDPFIGTGAHGHVYPGATTPFGMVQLSPDNGTSGWDWCSGYNWDDSLIVGFSHLHLSGTGIGDLLDISVMPTNADMDLTKQNKPRESSYAARFNHENEQAEPGYYKVELGNGITVELTASTYVGAHKYNFPEGTSAQVILDLGFALNWDRPKAMMIHQINERLITGYRHSSGWAKDQRVFFAMEFSAPFELIIADSTTIKENTGEPIEGRKLRGLFSFDNLDQVELKTGLSTASVEGAQAALQKVDGKPFEVIKNEASALWKAELSKVKAITSDTSILKTFYTALYRTSMAPNVLSDELGAYKGAGGNYQKATDYTRYSLFSLWDTFRAAHPLYTILQKDKIDDFIKSMLAHYEEYGLLPVWDLHANETNTMTGYHAIPVIVDAYFKGFRDYDVEKAYQAMKKSSMQDIRATDVYREYGYIPHDKSGQSVTRTLEYAYDDWCIAQMAKDLGHEEDYKVYMKRSEAYKFLFDEETGFMRAKLSDGTWKSPFDPKYSSHDFSVAEYTEGNAWQHSFFVPHAVEEMIALHGGNEPFVEKLDELFTTSSEITGDFASSDISGLVGQYAHGNEPSHHIVYLYNYADHPEKAQAQVRNIMKTQYNDTPYGLCGNEDCGQMSAWYVFSAMGIYPTNPANGQYDLGSPVLDAATIEVGEGKYFEIIAHSNSDSNVLVEKVLLNGTELDRTYIRHEEIMAGGKLEFFMKE
jgi:predicted alpha-1,2-mannosidase